MNPDLGWVDLGVKPDAAGFDSSLSRQIDPGMDRASRSAGSRFSAGFKKAAMVGIGASLAAGAAAFRFAGGAIEEAREAQKVGAQSAAVIKSTGQAANVTEKSLGKLAGRLSNMAGIDDELIQSGANVLLTFTKIRNETGKHNAIFDRATKAALNMSVALKQDLKGASVQVGKALNDPVKGVTALAKAGVQFTTQQRAQIKALVEGGDANAAMAMGLIDSTTTYNNLLKANGNDAAKVAQILKTDLTPAQKKAFDMYAEGGRTMDAQKRILKELDTQFKGSAKAQATEADKLDVAWGNFKETIGTELLPYLDDLAKFLRKEGIPAAERFADFMREKGIPAAKDLAKFARKAGGEIEDLAGFLNSLPDPAKYAGLAALVTGIGAAKFRSGKGALGGAGAALGMARPIPVRVVNWNAANANGGAVYAEGNDKDRKDGKGSSDGKSKTRGSAMKGKATGIAALVASIFGEEIVNEVKSEALWPWMEGPFAKPPEPAPKDKFTNFYGTSESTGGPSPDLARGFKEVAAQAEKVDAQVEALTKKMRTSRSATDDLAGSLKTVAKLNVKPRMDSSDIRTMQSELEKVIALAAAAQASVKGPQGAAIFGGAGRPEDNNRTPVFSGPVTIHANNPEDLLRRSQRRGLGGR